MIALKQHIHVSIQAAAKLVTKHQTLCNILYNKKVKYTICRDFRPRILIYLVTIIVSKNYITKTVIYQADKTSMNIELHTMMFNEVNNV